MLLTKLALPLLALPRQAKRVVALAVDASLIVLTVWIAFYLRLDEWVRLSGEGLFQPMWAIAASWLIALSLFITHGFTRVLPAVNFHRNLASRNGGANWRCARHHPGAEKLRPRRIGPRSGRK